MIELQSRFESQNSQKTFTQNTEAMVKAKNEHLLDRVKKIEKQVRDMEQ